MATAALAAARRAFSDAHIRFAVGSWSRAALAGHPDIDDFLDIGPAAQPTDTWRGFRQFVRQLRAGRYDLAISLVRSARMSMALRLSGIPYRAGIDSGGRGFGYQFRARIDPATPRHESEVYLDVMRALGVETAGCAPHIPLLPEAAETLRMKMAKRGIVAPYFMLHPGGGANPGMSLLAKRWPLRHFAALAERLAERWRARPVWLVGENESSLIESLPVSLRAEGCAFIGALSLAEIAQLAASALVYIGNDSGLSHLVAACGARTATIFGPSDPRRYAPSGVAVIALHRASSLSSPSALAQAARDWDWARDGISVDEAEAAIAQLVERDA